jgi:hypothetical protein
MKSEPFVSRKRLEFLAFLALLVCSAGVLSNETQPIVTAERSSIVDDDLWQQLETDSSVPVIVEFGVPGRRFAAHRGMRRDKLRRMLRERRTVIAQRREAVLGALADRLGHAVNALRYRNIPFFAMKADSPALQRLIGMREVVRVYEDRTHTPSLGNSVPLIGAAPAQIGGYDGLGTSIAILDTGVRTSHEFLQDSVLENPAAQACFSGTSVSGGAGTTVHSFCQDGRASALLPCVVNGNDVPRSACGPGAADPCTTDALCWHGTHVAGIALGYRNQSLSGVAPAAKLIPIQVFVDHSQYGLVAYDSDIISAVE